MSGIGPARLLGRDLFLPGGEKIPKGAIVATSQILSFFNPEVFENPHTFDPDRWANATKAMNESVIPFALGKRNCIGQRLAIAEIYSIIPHLLLKFRFEVEVEGAREFSLVWKYIRTKLKVSRV